MNTIAAPRDVFVCHAREDKVLVAAPLVARLEEGGFRVWYDEAEIRWGESVTEKVNWGLQNSRYVIVILSENFTKKNWPARELNAALNIEASSGEVKVLPLLVGDKNSIYKTIETYPILNDKRFLHWDLLTPQELVFEFVRLAGSSRHRQFDSSPQNLQTRLKVKPLLQAMSLGRLVSPGNENTAKGNVLSVVRQSATSVANRSSIRTRSEQLSILTGLAHSVIHLISTNIHSAFIEVGWSLLSDEPSLQLLSELLRYGGVDPTRVTLLIPEIELVEQSRLQYDFSSRLHGLSLGISEFGVGYSSLAYLKRIPISSLITSAAFSRGSPHPDSADMAVLQAIASLGQALGLATVLPVDTGEVDSSWVRKLNYHFLLVSPQSANAA